MKVPRELRDRLLAQAGVAPARKARRPRAARVAAAVPDGPMVAFDPSSTAIGAAAWDEAGNLIDLARYAPPGGWPLARRSNAIADWAGGFAERHGAAVAVVEVCSGKTYHASRASSLASLAFGQGAVYRAVSRVVPAVEAITELEWTNRRRKEARARDVRMLYPLYEAFASAGHDPGFDVADAIGLGLHFLMKTRKTP